MSNERRTFLKTGSLLAFGATLGSGAAVAGAAAGAAGAAAAAPHAAGPSVPHPSIPGKKFDINGVRYHIGDQGSGDNVVLMLHGMPDTSAAWRHQVPALVKAGYRVIVPDMLGYGETDKPQDPKRYGIEAILGDMIGLLDALGLKQVDLVGHDWGGVTSWELVLNFPERFRRHAVLSMGHVDVTMMINTIPEVRDSWYMYLNTQDAASALYAANDGAFLKKFFLPTHPELNEVWARMKQPEAMIGMLNWDRGNPMAAAYLAVANGSAAGRKCKVPTLGIWSERDTYLWESQMKDSGKLMAAQWRYARINGASHWMMLDRPQQTNQLLIGWLTKA